MSLESEMRGVLLRLEMLSHGSVSVWNKSGGDSGEPDDRTVAQVLKHENPPHIRFRIMFDRQETDFGRLAVLKEAREELETWSRRTAPRAETSASFEELVLEDGHGWDAETVAQRFNCSPALIRRVRQRHGREVERGRDPEKGEGDLPERAREMRGRGLTTRQVALSLGTAQSNVVRWTRKDAA